MKENEFLSKKMKEIADADFLIGNYGGVRSIFFDEGVFIERKSTVGVVDKIGIFLLNILIAGAALVIVGYYLPGSIEKFLSKYGNDVVRANENINKQEMIIWQPVLTEREIKRVKPEYDLELMTGKWLKIPSASIEAQIMTNSDIEDKKEVNKILDKGIYVYPDYAEMGWSGKTVILAGHHFNMTVEAKEGRKTFQNLDKTQVGDEVILTDDYKKWKYEIYKMEKATSISEKEADLIMYTCVFWWDSELRFFVYGRLIES